MSNKPKIPSWQLASAESPVAKPLETEQSQPAEQPEESKAPIAVAPIPTDDDMVGSESTTPIAVAPIPTEDDVDGSGSTSLLEQARRFLEDSTIRDAPRDKKIAFLESKGVSAEDIETLLGDDVQAQDSSELGEAGERAWSTTPLKPAQLSQPNPQPRDIPPIVTYPEFLAQTEKPPPLITTQRLVNTTYIAGGLMATIYGLSKYIIAPMTQDLAEARHDLATHAQEQLVEFNKQLSQSVSVDPATKTKSKDTDVADDVSEADSDPTELYHRDYGTQTTPELSRRPSAAGADDPEPTVTAHENRLKIIKSHLQELETTKSNHTSSADSLRTKVSDLTSYLSEMSYQNQYYSNGLYGSSFGIPTPKDGRNDEIEVLKSDIRAVKGVFLSARNFPTGGRSTPAMPTGRVGA